MPSFKDPIVDPDLNLTPSERKAVRTLMNYARLYGGRESRVALPHIDKQKKSGA